MNPRILLLVGCLAALALVGYLVFGPGDAPAPGPVVTATPEDDLRHPDVGVDPEAAAAPGRRSSVAAGGDGASGTATTADPGTSDAAATRVTIEGRIVDVHGAPVAAATVRVRARPDPRVIFRDGPPRGGDFGELLRPRDFPEPAVSDTDGRYRLAATTFASGNFEIGVAHPDFAPSVATRAWNVAESGDRVTIEPITLRTGARVIGRVVDHANRPLGGATVTVEPQGAAPFGPGAAAAGSLLRELLAQVTTDATGRFASEHAPPGRLRAVASARGHLDAASEPQDVADGAVLDLGEIRLGPGAVLTGIVVDARGQPIADAELTATLSRDAVRQLGRGGEAEGNPLIQMLTAGVQRRTARSGADGRFEFAAVPERGVRVEVRHPRFVTREVEPVEPLVTPDIRIELDDRIGISGVVVDAATGAPVETFAIAARPVRDAGGPGSPVSVDGGELRVALGSLAFTNEAGAAPDRAARIAELRAQQERQEAWLQSRLGGVGMLPGPTPEPGPHPDGRFEIRDLEPGTYVIDIDAPGYVKVTHGRFEIGTEPVADLSLAVERGVALSGRVVDARSGAPVADARLTLRLPSFAADTPRPARPGLFGDNRVRGMGLASARSGADGAFELPPQRPGAYTLSIEAENYPDFEDPDCVLAADAAERVVELDPGATVRGVVRGVADGARIRVVFVHAATGDRRAAPVDDVSRRYELIGLRAGGWFAQVEKQGESAGDGFRRRIGQAIATRTGEPDVFVPVGGEVTHDIAAADVDLGVVRGRVFRGGAAGTGLTVRLDPVGSPDASDEAQRMFRRLARMSAARVDADGAFQLDSVVPGDYQLIVAGGDGGGGFGGGRGPELHREALVVRKGGTVEVSVAVDAATRTVRLLDAEGAKLAGRSRLVLVRAAEAGERPPEDWGSLASRTAVDFNGSERELRDFSIGAWRYALQRDGQNVASGTIELTAGTDDAFVIRLAP